MGTIAARDCIRTLELTEQVAAASSFACAQALELRKRSGELSESDIGTSLSHFRQEVFAEAAFVTEDRRLDTDLRRLGLKIQLRQWELYP